MTLRERIAEKEHEQWAHWTRYILDNLTPENIERWKRQAYTPYLALTEVEKDADRKWADIILSIPITVECRECGGRGNKTISFNPNLNPNKFPAVECRKVPCPHCTNGQRVWKKVKRCPNWGIEQIHHSENCGTCKGKGTITEPLTLADIDFTEGIKLKGEWEVD